MTANPPEYLPAEGTHGNWNRLREERKGLMIHYDASASDRGAVAWLTTDERCHVSYNWLLLDDGTVRTIAPPNARAWHAGVCKPSDPRLPYRDANSAFFGIAWAGTDGEVIPPAALEVLVAWCAAELQARAWETWRIKGHEEEAWPRGRKHDPTGSDPRHPVIDLPALRARVAALLSR